MLQKAHALADELIRIRRDIHRHPELAFRFARLRAAVIPRSSRWSSGHSSALMVTCITIFGWAPMAGYAPIWATSARAGAVASNCGFSRTYCSPMSWKPFTFA